MQLSTITDNLDVYAEGFLTTLQLTAVGAAGALVLGTVLAALRVSPVPVLRGAGLTYVETFRNFPLPVLAVLLVFGGPKVAATRSFFFYVVLAVVLYHAAFVCEALRSGINSVGVGQGEAARALGLPFRQVLGLVVLPQAFRTVVPPLGNVLIALTKNTSVAATVGVLDLTAQTNKIISDTVDPLAAVLGAAACYLVLTLPTGLLLGRLERRTAFAR
ncbi:MAG: polar amino acid transporter, inner rane subunit [Frankiales bacterium]|nr:polar amino acid transporter, inner rane subunit [Frankiales bacterium]